MCPSQQQAKSFSVVLLVTLDGLLKSDAPGSLLQPATTYLFPESWMTLPLSFGLVLAPWGGHAVFPSVRHQNIFVLILS